MASVTFSHWEPLRPSRKRPQWTVRFWTRRLAWAIGIASALLLLAESALWCVEAFYELPVEGVLTRTGVTLPPNTTIRGGPVNGLGYWDDDFQTAPRAGIVRVALLGGRATLAGDATSNLAAELERRIPGVQIDHFGIPEGTPQEYAVQLQRDVLRFQPQFVLLCLSPTDDVASAYEAADRFTPLLWRLSESFAARPGAGTAEAALQRLLDSADYETYVRRRTAAVRVCRSGEDEALERRWRDAQAGLQRIVRACEKREIGVGVLFAPSEFQLSAELAEALRRRAGIAAEQFDVDLPQRRWTALADHLQLPSLDLLPTFRAADAVLFQPSSPDWNVQGCTLAADTTARWLQGRLSASAGTIAQSQ